jgi:hypothetical protein
VKSFWRKAGVLALAAVAGFAIWMVSGGTLPLPVAYVLGLWPRTGSYSMGGVEINVVVDEELVPNYQLPALLRAEDGSPVTTSEDWPARRTEILEAFQTHVYGRTPRVPGPVHVEVLSRRENALAGRAESVQARVYLLGREGPHVDVLAYRPKVAIEPVPTFVAWNFQGNHTVHADAAIRLPESPVPAGGLSGGVRPADATDRGSTSARWPIKEILARGYGFVTAYPGDFLLDDAGFARDGLLGELGSEQESEQWGAIGGWAFGLSRLLDWIESEAGLDGSRVAVLGHSRMGKAALWAGAQDERFALVISNDSGCAGAALSRRRFGESVSTIQTLFPHWFAPAFRAYADNESALPVDQHQLLAAIAPRPVYVASAADDLWADPKGEFLALHAAFPAWALHGAVSPLPREFPEIGASSSGAVGHHLRAGDHDLTSLDWDHFLEFADRHLGD